MSKAQDHQIAQDLASKDLVPRSDLTQSLNNVYSEIKGLRADIQGELKDLNTIVLNAITHRGGGS